MNNEEKINEFLRWLDMEGYNFYIIEAIRKMLFKGQEIKFLREQNDDGYKERMNNPNT